MRDRRRRPRWRRRSFCRDRTPPHRRAFPGAPSRLVGVTDKSSDPVARLPLLLLPVCLTNEFFLCAGRTPAECWFPIASLSRLPTARVVPAAAREKVRHVEPAG